MITEDYVSPETTKLLKEKGFDLYEVKSWVAKPQDESTLKRDGFPTLEDFIESEDFVELPITPYHYPLITLQMAMKWLEEKYGVFCVIRRHGNKDDGFTYSWNCEGEMGLSVGNSGGFKTAAKAGEAAIKYCLENLI